MFKAALQVCGKRFHQDGKWVQTKLTKESVEFYYMWKKIFHGRSWKGGYEEEEEEDGNVSNKGGKRG
ncbi:hypothetical protein ACHAWF_018733 [Thalassiosira exigua]